MNDWVLVMAVNRNKENLYKIQTKKNCTKNNSSAIYCNN